VAEGWVQRGKRQGKRGRPVDLFSLSDQGRGLFGEQIDRFTRVLLEELARQEGQNTLDAVIDSVGEKLAGQLGPQIGEGTTLQRLERLAGLLAQRGTLNEITRSGNTATMTIHTCAYHGVAGETDLLCKMERNMLRRLIGGDARLTRCRPAGDERCEMQINLPIDGNI